MTPTFFAGPVWATRRVTRPDDKPWRGPRSPHAVASLAAANEARKVADNPTAPVDVRTAARAIVNSHEYQVPVVPLHIELVLAYLHKQHRQDRFGK